MTTTDTHTLRIQNTITQTGRYCYINSRATFFEYLLANRSATSTIDRNGESSKVFNN